MNSHFKSALVYGGLLVVLLGASWSHYTADPQPELGEKVVLLEGEKDTLEKIVWIGENDKAVVESKVDAQGRYLWVTYTKVEDKHKDHGPKPAGPEAGAEPTPPVPETPEKVETTSVFKVGEAGDKLIESLSPLLAIRKLEAVEPDKLATIGMDAPKEFIEITRKGRTTKLELGGEAYGSRDRYARDATTGELYLVDDETIRPLKYARTRLPDRTLTSLTPEKIAKATIADAGGKKLELVQENAVDTAKARWVRAGQTEGSAQLKTWMDQALKLKGTAYAGPDDTPATLEERFALTLVTEAGKAETLRFQQAGPDGDWYATSEHTRGLIKLLRGPTGQLAEDVPSLFEGEAAGPPPGAPN